LETAAPVEGLCNKSRKQQDTEQEPEPKKEERPRRDFITD